MTAPIKPSAFTDGITPVEGIFERLRAAFPIDRISWRVGATTQDKSRGMAVCYIDARDVADRLDEACTPAGWQCRYPHANGKTVCEIGIKIDGEWIWKSDGAGDTDREAEKGALSDAFKRAGVRWGIARYLYDIPGVWIEIENNNGGKSHKIKDTEMARLRGALGSGAPMQIPGPVQKSGHLPYQPEITPGKQAFIEGRKGAIAKFTDYDALGEWWNSEMEQKARRAAGLDPTEVEALKQIVMARRDALRKSSETV